MGAGFKAITLDLDDTLWPVWPAIVRAEESLHRWLVEHAAATAAAYDRAGLRILREQVAADHPEQAHDLSWLRQTSIARALIQAGDDPGLAEPAFAHFFEHRQRVELYPDVAGALGELARRLPLLALTNGNADLARIGLADHFVGVQSACEFGAGKPEAAFFHAACRRLGCEPSEVLHVGDDWRLDIEGADAAGLPCAWIRRPGQAGKPAGHRAQPWRELNDLNQLLAALDAPAVRMPPGA